VVISPKGKASRRLGYQKLANIVKRAGNIGKDSKKLSPRSAYHIKEGVIARILTANQIVTTEFDQVDYSDVIEEAQQFVDHKETGW